MPGPSKNKSGTGLKILWIPGRKKHHDKGTYRPTNYNVEHKHGERKNEPWSLGGSKTHDEIVGGHDKDDKDDLLNPSTPVSTILSSASLGVATVDIDECSEPDNEIKLAKTDYDSIERIDDLDGQPTLPRTNGKKSNDKPKTCKRKTKEDKAVKCLYYTMMCCECTIS